ERLRFLSQMRSHAQMMRFNIGDRVTFQPEGGTAIFGMLTRYNKKTVTVITDDGQRWNISPGLLRKEKPDERTDIGDSNVIELKQR
ncbi:MAG: hypothetical protein MUO43_04405, partial [Desulfobacterales bacterium]|nr:hypothetical protein [Desulfobacterales bacterium]